MKTNGRRKTERNKFYQGDVLEVLKTFPDEWVDCCITSPPYWGLRDYGVGGQLGLEKTPEEYVAKMVKVFREVKRVLKKEGTLWLNLGDSYATAHTTGTTDDKTGWKHGKLSKGYHGRAGGIGGVVKPKDLVGIPWRVAFALQADVWWLRQDIIWHKPNPMPESVRDRCTKAHEYIFLLAKSKKYYYDGEAIKEKANYDGRKDTLMKGSPKYKDGYVPNQQPQTVAARGHERWKKDSFGNRVRNKRSVWTITTKPFKEAHFATFPPKLIEPMIKAGTSEKGVCPKCGKAWERILKKGGGSTGHSWHDHSDDLGKGTSQTGKSELEKKGGDYFVKTLGWQPTCKCNKEPVPAVVLDPFMGSGTTAYVAEKLGRDWVGIELNKSYVEIAEKRLAQRNLL